MSDHSERGVTRREALLAAGTMAAGAVLASVVPGAHAQAAPAATSGGRKGGTVPLNWKEVYFTNCPMVSANNIDQELGWCKTDFKAIGIDYSYFRSRRETDWYPHYIHNQENLIRFGGLYPPIHVQADIRRTRLLGCTWVYEGGCMAVRIDDPIYRMKDLKGKRIALSKSLNTIKNDWWRIQEHMGIANMLMLNDMTMKDVEIVEFPYADDWYDDPRMMEPMINPTDLWATRDHKRDLAFRPMEAALLGGKVDAIYTQSKVFQHLQEDTGKIRMIEDLTRYPDYKLQVANTPAVITCTDVMANEHPELVVTYMKAMIKVGRWANQFPEAAAHLLDRQTFYRDPEDTYQGIKDVDMVPNLSPQNLECVETGKEFMLRHGYIKNDFDVRAWAAPEFMEQAAKDLIEEQWKKKSAAKLPEVTELQAESRRIG
jgi:ABC-type nitrate/sulfonate/bicarbonate transport system substrate-binding protein